MGAVSTPSGFIPGGTPLAAEDQTDGPIISVIVPTFDRPQALERCLRALAAQTLSHRQFETIVCDDGSATPVAERQRDLLAELRERLQVRVERQANQGPAAARNLGAEAARGRYLAFTDDDCEPAPEWLERLLACLTRDPELLVGGAMRNGLPANPYASATHAIMDFVYAEYGRYSAARPFSTSNLSLPAAGFRQIGGFSREYPDAAGEDYDLCYRWQESGRRVAFAPEAVIVHRHVLTLREYLAQHFRYGRGLLRTRRRQRARHSLRPTPRPGFYARLVLHPLRSWHHASAWRSAFLIGVSQVATVLGAATELVRPTRRRVTLDSGAQRADARA